MHNNPAKSYDAKPVFEDKDKGRIRMVQKAPRLHMVSGGNILIPGTFNYKAIVGHLSPARGWKHVEIQVPRMCTREPFVPTCIKSHEGWRCGCTIKLEQILTYNSLNIESITCGLPFGKGDNLVLEMDYLVKEEVLKVVTQTRRKNKGGTVS